MSIPTYAQFIRALDAAGFVQLSDVDAETRPRALFAEWFPALTAPQQVTIGAVPEPELTPGDLFAASGLPPASLWWGVADLERACRPPEVAAFLNEHPEVRHD
jgi:hypothetical protein